MHTDGWIVPTAAAGLPLENCLRVEPQPHPPVPGDALLVRVESLGWTDCVQDARDAECPRFYLRTLRPGDTLVAVCGRRCGVARGKVVEPSCWTEVLSLHSRAGLVGAVVHHPADLGPYTRVKVLGALIDHEGRVMNTRSFGLPLERQPKIVEGAKIVLVTGTDTNAGKSKAVEALLCCLAAAGRRPAAGKATGVCCRSELSRFYSLAKPLVDFSCFGIESTIGMDPVEAQLLYLNTAAYLSSSSPDVIVIELADGILNPQTAAILKHPQTRKLVTAVLFASATACGAVTGIRELRAFGYERIWLTGQAGNCGVAVEQVEPHIGVLPTFNPFVRKDDELVELLLSS